MKIGIQTFGCVSVESLGPGVRRDDELLLGFNK
jgi:hypothetical protein